MEGNCTDNKTRWQGEGLSAGFAGDPGSPLWSGKAVVGNKMHASPSPVSHAQKFIDSTLGALNQTRLEQGSARTHLADLAIYIYREREREGGGGGGDGPVRAEDPKAETYGMWCQGPINYSTFQHNGSPKLQRECEASAELFTDRDHAMKATGEWKQCRDDLYKK